MAVSREVRRDRFAAFVRAALEGARIQRGWTVGQVLDVTGVGKTTLYRWLNGEWASEPEAAKVLAVEATSVSCASAPSWSRCRTSRTG